MIKMSEQGLKDYLVSVSEMGGNIMKAGMSRIALFRKIVEYELEVYNKLNFLSTAGQYDKSIMSGFFWSP